MGGVEGILSRATTGGKACLITQIRPQRGNAAAGDEDGAAVVTQERCGQARQQ